MRSHRRERKGRRAVAPATRTVSRRSQHNHRSDHCSVGAHSLASSFILTRKRERQRGRRERQQIRGIKSGSQRVRHPANRVAAQGDRRLVRQKLTHDGERNCCFLSHDGSQSITRSLRESCLFVSRTADQRHNGLATPVSGHEFFRRQWSQLVGCMQMRDEEPETCFLSRKIDAICFSYHDSLPAFASRLPSCVCVGTQRLEKQ